MLVDGAAAGEGPLALFLDVDGTLLDLAGRPGDVTTPAGLLDSLGKAERKLGGAVALISGRTIRELDHLFAPSRFRAAGVHGAEIRSDPDGEIRRLPGARELPQTLWIALEDLLREFPGTFAENKGFSYAVHYRLAPAGAEARLRHAVLRLIETEADAPVEVLNAHCAIELKAPGADKGRAIASFLVTPPFIDRTPIFVGDDTTDEAGFAVVSERGGSAYSVGARRPGTVGAFAGPQDVRDWLAGFVEERAAS
jgi:trehalose 6-phosphate phosphatase